LKVVGDDSRPVILRGLLFLVNTFIVK
jgi:hypothetical protein